jgi:hypothetical protein
MWKEDMMRKRRIRRSPVFKFVVGGFLVFAAVLWFTRSLLLEVEVESAEVLAGLIVLAAGAWNIYGGIKKRGKMESPPRE